ncbi:MAG: carboxypeptidase-like regulatory domain-containing protein [Cyclobacteriaceae bacterium]
MFKKCLVLLVLLGVGLGCFGQALIIQGTISNVTDKTAISFAHVGVCGKTVGTVANDKGEYLFNLPAYVRNDSLCATAIGFHTYTIAISELRNGQVLNIELKPQTSYLDEVVIKDDKITAQRVIKKAAQQIKKNYPKQSFVLDGYYRDYLKKGNEYISFLESAVSIQDPGFRKPESKSKIKIHQMRFNEKYKANFANYIRDFESDTTKVLIHGISPAFRGNELSNMRYHDPIRNLHYSVPFIGDFATFADRNYDFEIEYYTYLDGKEVYVINIAPSKKYNYTHVDIKGKLYIRVDDYAVVKFNYEYHVTRRLENRKWYELNLEYREVNGKMYLKYISYANYFKMMTHNEIAEMSQYREFFVNDIQTSNFENIATEEIIDSNTPLYQQKVADIPGFWENYNRLLLEQPLKE